MEFKKVTAIPGFWKSVIILALSFIIIYNAIDLLFSYSFNFSAFTEDKLSGTNAIRYIVANVIGGFCYGFIVVFLQFRKRLKREKDNT